jgi:hypothetical protein
LGLGLELKAITPVEFPLISLSLSLSLQEPTYNNADLTVKGTETFLRLFDLMEDSLNGHYNSMVRVRVKLRVRDKGSVKVRVRVRDFSMVN